VLNANLNRIGTNGDGLAVSPGVIFHKEFRVTRSPPLLEASFRARASSYGK
jgi:hypothetical protein